jgi:hypothetical protein
VWTKKGLLDYAAPQFGILQQLLIAQKSAYARPRLAGYHQVFPIRRRRLVLGGQDLYLIAVLQLRAQGHIAAIDLCADAMVADFGVDRIGEIDRG